MPEPDLVKLGEEIIALRAAWPGTGLEEVGEFARCGSPTCRSW
ncbi:hypothetical protein [Lentzea aerocolonigenes]|nr:hypothetical protein [Lentzea aerocolonigenes]MCP2249405.1 hypothetical protein [Lentzea aerocolonigenes]